MLLDMGSAPPWVQLLAPQDGRGVGWGPGGEPGKVGKSPSCHLGAAESGMDAGGTGAAIIQGRE